MRSNSYSDAVEYDDSCCDSDGVSSTGSSSCSGSSNYSGSDISSSSSSYSSRPSSYVNAGSCSSSVSGKELLHTVGIDVEHAEKVWPSAVNLRLQHQHQRQQQAQLQELRLPRHYRKHQ
jgi:hypothetical protein